MFKNIKLTLILYVILLIIVLGLAGFITIITSMDFILFTLINVLVIELSFLLGKWLLNKRFFAKEFLVSLLLVFIIFIFSFGGMVAGVFQHISFKGNHFTIFEILIIFFNTFWSYFRGLARINNVVSQKSKEEAENWRFNVKSIKSK